jgi:hypothetical protein
VDAMTEQQIWHLISDIKNDLNINLDIDRAMYRVARAMQPKKLSDDRIGQIWFSLRLQGCNEGEARRLVRAVEDELGAV